MSDDDYVPMTRRLRPLVPPDMVTTHDFGPPWGRCEAISLRDLMILDGLPLEEMKRIDQVRKERGLPPSFTE